MRVTDRSHAECPHKSGVAIALAPQSRACCVQNAELACGSLELLGACCKLLLLLTHTAPYSNQEVGGVSSTTVAVQSGRLDVVGSYHRGAHRHADEEHMGILKGRLCFALVRCFWPPAPTPLPNHQDQSLHYFRLHMRATCQGLAMLASKLVILSWLLESNSKSCVPHRHRRASEP